MVLCTYMRSVSRVCLAILVLAASVTTPSRLGAQTTSSTGSIQGTVTDQTGAVVSGATIAITSKERGQVIHVTTTSTGTYASGSLVPGSYLVRVENEGFKAAELSVVVQVGVTSPGNISLQLGQSTQVVKVDSSDVRVNTEQTTIQG